MRSEFKIKQGTGNFMQIQKSDIKEARGVSSLTFCGTTLQQLAQGVYNPQNLN